MVRPMIAILVGALMFMSGERPAHAQRDAASNPREMLQRGFEAAGLEVGGPFPDVRIYDAEGNPFRTGALKGGYTVLVTGCLT